MQPTPKPRSRWRLWQFSLRDFLLLLLLAAVLAGWWRDRQNMQRRMNEILNQAYGPASWGIEQVLGPPDTSGTGDIPTAWASQTPDGQREWLVLVFPTAVVPRTVEIHETYNPGAVDSVSVWDPKGREIIAWTGADPTSPTAPRGVSVIPLNIQFKTRRIRIQLNSPNFPGWNEIDAVGLVGVDGRRQWASTCQASSSFGSAYRGFRPNPPALGGLTVPRQTTPAVLPVR